MQSSALLARFNAALKLNRIAPRTGVRCLCQASDAGTSSGSSGSGTTPTPTPTPTPEPFSYQPGPHYPPATAARVRPRSIENKLRLQEYRRQAAQQMRQMELEEERRTFQLDKDNMYPKGHPKTVQGVVKEIIDIGYILALPDGRDGLLTAMHLGCSGGVELLSRLIKVGEEVPVRVIKVPFPHGKDRCYIRDINSLTAPWN